MQKPIQTPWIIIAEENWRIEVTIVKLVLSWVTATPGRFRSIKSLHVGLFGMNLERRFLCILIFLVFVLPHGLDSKMFCFSCRTLVLPLWKLGCCVNGLSCMDLVNASLCSANPRLHDHISVCPYLSEGKYKFFVLFLRNVYLCIFVQLNNEPI